MSETRARRRSGGLVAARFPSIPVIHRREMAAAIQSVAHDTLWILRAIALLILAVGAAVLILMVLAEERTRTRESPFSRPLAPGPLKSETHSWPSSPGWRVAGASGGVMGSAFATLLLSVVFRKAAPAWDMKVFAGAILLGDSDLACGRNGRPARVPSGASRSPFCATNSHNRNLIRSAPYPSPSIPHPPCGHPERHRPGYPQRPICGHHGTLRQREDHAARFAGGLGLADQRPGPAGRRGHHQALRRPDGRAAWPQNRLRLSVVSPHPSADG